MRNNFQPFFSHYTANQFVLQRRQLLGPEFEGITLSPVERRAVERQEKLLSAFLPFGEGPAVAEVENGDLAPLIEMVEAWTDEVGVFAYNLYINRRNLQPQRYFQLLLDCWSVSVGLYETLEAGAGSRRRGLASIVFFLERAGRKLRGPLLAKTETLRQYVLEQLLHTNLY